MVTRTLNSFMSMVALIEVTLTLTIVDENPRSANFHDMLLLGGMTMKNFSAVAEEMEIARNVLLNVIIPDLRHLYSTSESKVTQSKSMKTQKMEEQLKNSPTIHRFFWKTRFIIDKYTTHLTKMFEFQLDKNNSQHMDIAKRKTILNELWNHLNLVMEEVNAVLREIDPDERYKSSPNPDPKPLMKVLKHGHISELERQDFDYIYQLTYLLQVLLEILVYQVERV